MMVIAHHAGNSPGAVLVLPKMNEAAFADSFSIFMTWMVEPVYTHFNRAVTLHIENMKRSRDTFARGLSADVFLDAFGSCGAAEGYSALIVIELDVFGEEGSEFFQIAFVVGIEEGCIERRDGLVEFGLRLNFLERRNTGNLCATD